jgi:hypothetical protein
MIYVTHFFRIDGCYRLDDAIIPLSAKWNPAKRQEGCKQFAGSLKLHNQ